MKTTPLFLIAMLLLFTYSCEEKIDLEKEKDAIMAVVDGADISYQSRDLDQWRSYFVQDSTFLYTSENQYGYNIVSDWATIDSNNQQFFTTNPVEVELNKIPIAIKIYEETAWVVQNVVMIRENGATMSNQIRTDFLEKQDGNWKLAYTNTIMCGNYMNPSNYALTAISYVKSLGKSVEELSGYVGDQFFMGSNPAGGINPIANNVMSYVRTLCPYGDFQVLERDDDHIVISAKNILKPFEGGSRFDVTYDEYLTYLRVMYERYAYYLGVNYNQETTVDGILITVSNN